MNGIIKKTVLVLTIVSPLGLKAMGDNLDSPAAQAFRASAGSKAGNGQLLALSVAAFTTAGIVAYKWWSKPKPVVLKPIVAAQNVAAIKAEAQNEQLMQLLQWCPKATNLVDEAVVSALIDQVIAQNNPMLLVDNQTVMNLFKDVTARELFKQLCSMYVKQSETTH